MDRLFGRRSMRGRGSLYSDRSARTTKIGLLSCACAENCALLTRLQGPPVKYYSATPGIPGALAKLPKKCPPTQSNAACDQLNEVSSTHRKMNTGQFLAFLGVTMDSELQKPDIL